MLCGLAVCREERLEDWGVGRGELRSVWEVASAIGGYGVGPEDDGVMFAHVLVDDKDGVNEANAVRRSTEYDVDPFGGGVIVILKDALDTRELSANFPC